MWSYMNEHAALLGFMFLSVSFLYSIMRRLLDMLRIDLHVHRAPAVHRETLRRVMIGRFWTSTLLPAFASGLYSTLLSIVVGSIGRPDHISAVVLVLLAMQLLCAYIAYDCIRLGCGGAKAFTFGLLYIFALALSIAWV